MATVTDDDVLELVDRFDISIEDTATTEKLQSALADKLEAAGVPYVSDAFLEKFQSGLTLKYEILPEVQVGFKAYHRESSKNYPGGYWQPVYRDIGTGQFISHTIVSERIANLRALG